MKLTTFICLTTLQCYSVALSQEASIRPIADSSNQISLRIEFSSPFVNELFIQKDFGRSHYLRIAGYSGGLEFSPTPNRALTFKVGTTIDLRWSENSALLSGSRYRNSYESFFVTTCYYVIKNGFRYGLGLHYTKLTWERDSAKNVIPASRINEGLGILGSLRLSVTESVIVGLNYQPTIVQLNSEYVFEYQHLISFEVSFSLKLFAGAA